MQTGRINGFLMVVLMLFFISNESNSQDWEQLNNGLTDLEIIPLVIDPSNSNILYVGTFDGYFKTTDAGQNWHQINSGIPLNPWGVGHITGDSLIINPKTTNIIYAGGDEGAFKSVDGGVNWFAASNGLSGKVRSMAINPEVPTTIYAGTLEDELFRTMNGGDSWVKLRDADCFGNQTIAIDPFKPEILLIRNCSDSSSIPMLFKSIDAGETWQDIFIGIEEEGERQCVNNIAFSQSNENIVYAATDTNELYESKDAGDSWSTIATNIDQSWEIDSIAIDPQKPDTIYIGMNSFTLEEDAIRRSTDGGNTWTHITVNTNGWGAGTGIAIDQNNTDTIYVSVYYVGVFRTTFPSNVDPPDDSDDDQDSDTGDDSGSDDGSDTTPGDGTDDDDSSDSGSGSDDRTSDESDSGESGGGGGGGCFLDSVHETVFIR